MTTPSADGYKPTFKFYTIDELDQLDDGSPDPAVVAYDQRKRRGLEAMWEWERTGVWPPDPDDLPYDADKEMWAPEGGDPRFALLSEHDFPPFGKFRITHIPDNATFPAVGCELRKRGTDEIWRVRKVTDTGFEVEQVLSSAGDRLQRLQQQQSGAQPINLRVVRADTVKQEPIEWLWENRFARGKSSLIGGDPGQGKSQIVCDVIARISRGLPWPDGSGKAPLGSCIILSAEDNTEDTIAPRLTAAGADLSKVYIVDAVEVVDGSSRSFSLATDLNQLAQLVETIGDVALIMIDPITAYLGADLDSHRTTAVRAVMQPVDKFAAEHEVAILGITHPPKATQSKAIHSFTGSLAFIAAARTGFIVVTEDDTDRRLLLAVKNNVGPMAHGLGYVIEPVTTPAAIKTSRIVWDGLPVTMSADEAIQVSNHRDKGDERVEAENFLRGYLENGPMPADQVKAAAKENGISERTLWRAKKQVGVVAEKGSYKEGWRWRLPETWRPAGWAGG